MHAVRAAAILVDMATWTDEEIFMLIEEWGDEKIQEKLEGCTGNKAVYEAIAHEINAAGHTRTAVQCREKNEETEKRLS